MSTKTTFKRIALVTVAALGFGVMSTVAPASASVAMDTLTVVDGTGSVGDSVTATSASATVTFLPSDAEDSVTVVASLVSAPAGNTAFPRLTLAETTSAYVDDVKATSGNAVVLGTEFAAYTNAIVAPMTASVTTSVKYNVFIGTVAAGAVTAGTYVVRITPTARPTAGTATFKDITITIAAPTQSSSLSTAYIASGTTAPTSTTDIAAVVAANTAKTAVGDAAANIKVTQLKASGAAASESITATITGPGTLGCGPTQSAGNAASSGRALTCQTGSGIGYINIYGDGTSGKATVTLKGTTSGHSYATKTLTFSSTTIAKLTATAVNPVVSATGTSATDAVSVVATDADGNQIYSPTVYVVSSATSVLSNAYSTTGCNWDSTDLVTYCDVTPVAAGTANITFTNRASATATSPTTRVDSNAVAIRVGSVSPASAKLSFDKATYLPGEKATLTLTLLDAAGNAVAGSADNTTYAATWAAGGITSDYAFYTGSDTLTATFARVSATTGLQTWTVYMPLQATELTVTGTADTIFPAAYQATKITAKASVGNPAGVDAATDAANEATDAANAATDAALAAADAADAATAAAQDASDAVAALSASVSKLISSLRAQITSLTNLVIKIQKKVKA